jgi:WhiB family redox-sensing transcriptional regulator
MLTLPEFLTAATALCAQTDPDLFHSTRPTDQEQAKTLCAACPLRTACLDWALDRSEIGVWGGTTTRERAALRRGSSWLDEEGRIRRPCGDEPAYQAHYRLGEECDVCQAAHEERLTLDRQKRLERAHAAGGTCQGAAIHRLLGEAPCRACRAAEAREVTARRERQRTGRQTLATAA